LILWKNISDRIFL